MSRAVFTLVVSLAVSCALGCNPRSTETQPAANKPAVHAEGRPSGNDAAKPKVARRNSSTGNSKRWGHDTSDDWLPPLASPVGATIGDGARSAWIAGIPFTEPQALDRIERELKDALKVRPTLVVWLFDQSQAAGSTRRALVVAAGQMHKRLVSGAPGKRGAAKEDDAKPGKLLTAMVAFGSQVKVLTPEPIADGDQLPAAEAIPEESAASTQAYSAIHAAAERFAKYRKQGHEVIFVLVAHRAAADEEKFNSATAILRRSAIPVFGIGSAAPFGRLADAISSATRSADAAVGSEAWFPERIELYLPDGQGDVELADSGYGPFHLERICRATEGRFLRLRPGGTAGWTTDEEGEVSAQLLRKYAPDYVREVEYRQILAENRACQALHEATQLPPAPVLIAPTYEFRKEEEAAMARALSNAQRAPAENQAALERLHETLAAGEADRGKLTRPRWQAGYDLAYGRACAARARNEGYNHMLAILKNGKAPSKPDSDRWSLKPADGIPGRSDLDKMAKNARTNLARVVKEHAGTPWAALAKRELETPCGWEWTER
jgi:hypothetical protein